MCFGVCIFFIIVKGISFGDEKVKKWLTSICVSLLASILVIQPLQVALFAFIFVIIFRSSNDKDDLDDDGNDDGKSLNTQNSWSNKKVNFIFTT